MQLRADALQSHLAKSLAPLYVVVSDEHLLALEAVDSIRLHARKNGFTERDVMVVDRHFKWPDLFAAAQSQSLFGDKKMIELRIPTGKPGREGAKSLADFTSGLHSDSLVIITLPRLDSASQKSAWVTGLKEHGVYIDIPLVERQHLPSWIGNRLAAQQQSADRASLDFITERVEGNLLAAHQEIQKLALLYPEGKLSFAQVQDAVLNVARYDVFKLNEAMLSGDIPRLMRMIDGLHGEGEALPLVLWAVTEEIRLLLRTKAAVADGKPISAALKEMRVWGPREQLVKNALPRLSLRLLEKALSQAGEIDRLVKGLRSASFAGDPWEALSRLALSIARSR